MKTLPKKQITVYCSSSNEIPNVYFSQTEKAIKILVENGYGIRYGGGARGLMGTVADTALKLGGELTGIIPVFMIEREWEHKGITDMIHVETMHERKAKLIENACAVLALPGGTGTLDELFDVISLKKLGLFPFPIIILNVNGFYDHLNDMAKRMIDEKFLETPSDSLWKMVSDPNEVMEKLRVNSC